MNMPLLHNLIAAVCPIVGVSVGDANDKNTWLITFAPEATAEQQTAALAALDGYVETPAAAALAQTVFTKLQIRRAMRELGIESTLDALLDGNATFRADWLDAQEIDLADPLTVQALASAAVDINAVKLTIAGLEV